MVLKKLLALTIAVAVPLTVSAQTAPADQPAKPAGEQAAQPPTPPPAKAAPAAPKVSVTPYGFVQGSAFFDQATFATKDYPAQVSRDQLGGAFLMSARYSRFGVKLALDDGNWTGATLGGEIEFDFKGGHIGTSSAVWYNGLMRLRLADVTATWKGSMGSLQILAGQNYGLVNPLFATTITWTADPLFWQAGNVWRRDPQFRVTAAAGPELLGLNVAVAMLSPHTADAAAAPFTSPDYGSGNASRMPDLEARGGINAKWGPVTLAAGLGYSFGKRRVVDTAVAATKPTKDIDGYLAGLDVSLGTPWVDVKAESFMQQGRGDVYNTILSTAPVGTTAGHFEPVQSAGGWTQAVVKPIPAIWIALGYGYEQAEKTGSNSFEAAGITSPNQRSQNQMLQGGVIFNAGKFWKFGVEAVRTETQYIGNDVPGVAAAVLKQTGTQVAVSTQLVF